MYFESPRKLSILPPNDQTITGFLFGGNDKTNEASHQRHPLSASKPPFTCGITGKAYSVEQVIQRYEALARALSNILGWDTNTGSEFDKAAAIYSLNSIDYLPVCWAIHRLSGVACPVSTTYSTSQLTSQLQATHSKAVFTSPSQLETAIEAAVAAGIPADRVYVLDVPALGLDAKVNGAAKGPINGAGVDMDGAEGGKRNKTVNELIEYGMTLPEIAAIKWTEGQGSRQTAFILPSSGTGGLPKNVMLTHKNVIANILQYNSREAAKPDHVPWYVLGVLPQSHAFALIGTCHMSMLLGLGVVILPSFDMLEMLRCIQSYRIEELWLIPPLVHGMLHVASMLKDYDLGCVKFALVGSSSLGKDTIAKACALLPNCNLCQGYGLTEATCAICVTPRDDFMLGSCGALFPGNQARLLDSSGNDVEDFDMPGELIVRGPSVVPGYLDNEVAMRESLTGDGWLRTGDLVEMRKSPKGNSHIFIIDRIKELIKVHSMQVAPAEIENWLLQHPSVAEAAVIPLPDEDAGELPRAYIVLKPTATATATTSDGGTPDHSRIRADMKEHADKKFSSYKRLAGGVEIVDSLPKTGSGKVQRNVLRDRARLLAAEMRRRHDEEDREDREEDRMQNGQGAVLEAEVLDFSDSDDE